MSGKTIVIGMSSCFAIVAICSLNSPNDLTANTKMNISNKLHMGHIYYMIREFACSIAQCRYG